MSTRPTIQEIEPSVPKLFLFAPSKEFVRPYFERLIPEYTVADEPADAVSAVMISSTDIYDVDEGLNINELAPLKDDCRELADEKRFIGICHELNLPYTILRCPSIVCTGMQGFARSMAEKIYRGTYIGLSGNTAVRSVVHAIDLPEAARNTLGRNDVYNVTDGSPVAVNELADALAWRMSQKRVFNLAPKWYRFLFGKKKMEAVGKSLAYSAEKLVSGHDFKPTPVVEYLKTHVYDEQSL